MQPFTYVGAPSRVVFGFGVLDRIPDEVKALGCSRALVLSTPQQADAGRDLSERLGGLSAGLFTEAAMHTPVEITERAMQVVRDSGADCTVALGGGSTTGLGKAIAVRTDLPQIVIPTTYAGSEATPILGETRDGLKTTQKSPKILPEVIVYDVDLTLTLPPGLSAASGMNAIAHAVEGLYTQDANPIVSLMAEEGIRALGAALPRIVRDPADREARSDALYGAWLCGVGEDHGMGLGVRQVERPAEGVAELVMQGHAHRSQHHAAAYNAPAAPEAMARAARALGVKDAPQGLYDLAKGLGAPTALKDIDMPEAGLDRAAELATANPYWNPRPIERAAIRALLDDAFHGRRPSATSA